MGLSLCKRNYYCCCCCCCTTDNKKLNSVDVLANVKLKVLLLGQVGSGKTEVGHALSHKPRVDYEPTNGAQYYRIPLTRILATGERGGEMAITEVGGNEEMQKIWPHYYTQTMAIIYCFDLSTSNESMWRTFQLLDQLLRHEFVRGKPILLVATKSQLVDSGVQLYDIENEFQLEKLARNCGSSIRLCSYERATIHDAHEHQVVGNSLSLGIHWLAKYLLDNWCILSIRIKCDENTKNWQQEQLKLIAVNKRQQQHRQNHMANGVARNRRRGRFWRFSKFNRFMLNGDGRIRPHTAPPRAMHLSTEYQQQHHIHFIDSTTATSIMHATATTVTSTHDNNNSNVRSEPVPNGHINPHIEHA